jgi:hypothetical protein
MGARIMRTSHSFIQGGHVAAVQTFYLGGNTNDADPHPLGNCATSQILEMETERVFAFVCHCAHLNIQRDNARRVILGSRIQCGSDHPLGDTKFMHGSTPLPLVLRAPRVAATSPRPAGTIQHRR